MKRSLPFLPLAVAALLLCGASPAIPGPSPAPDIPIIVDGVPLDARAVMVTGEPYIPAWILENYTGTRVRWVRQGKLLEISTTAKSPEPTAAAGTIKVKVGSYLASEGFVVGKATRLFLLNVDPKEFRFPDGRTAAERAHEGTVERIGQASPPARDYLRLSPTDRFSQKGWEAVARMPKEEIAGLPALADRYEALYTSLYYDLLTNLVLETERRVREAGTLDPGLKQIAILSIPVSDDGLAAVKAPEGVKFLYGRMLYGNRQIVWDVPVAVRGGAETSIELSHRNAALTQ
ncbi:MAG: hypothetical protein HZB86_03675 [Deltaproteobacteria bacterium]|nr:hypothetical protein [Deltaproteobacteria bacterium]